MPSSAIKTTTQNCALHFLNPSVDERAAPSDLELSKSGDSVTVKWSMKGGSPNKFRVEYFITNKPNQVRVILYYISKLEQIDVFQN